MKNWIRFILRVNHKLDNMCQNVDKRVDMLSRNIEESATSLAQEIYNWIDFKRRLVNLRILYKKLKDSFTNEQWQELIDWRDYKKPTTPLTKQCQEIMHKEGYHNARFIEDYQKNMQLYKMLLDKTKTQPTKK